MFKEGCFKEFFWVFHVCFVLSCKVVKKCFKNVLRLFQGCFKNMSWVFQVLLCNFIVAWDPSQLSKQKEGFFKNISIRIFHDYLT